MQIGIACSSHYRAGSAKTLNSSSNYVRSYAKEKLCCERTVHTFETGAANPKKRQLEEQLRTPWALC